ncbi:hypothetical protein D9M71_842780 [compost metagenome]
MRVAGERDLDLAVSIRTDRPLAEVSVGPAIIRIGLGLVVLGCGRRGNHGGWARVGAGIHHCRGAKALHTDFRLHTLNLGGQLVACFLVAGARIDDDAPE